MRRYGFFIVMAVALLLLGGNGAVADEQSLPDDAKAYYAACIDRIIDKCAHKEHLCTCSSPVLRAYGDRMVQKSAFCRLYKEQLIQSMLAHELEPKAYKVEHFINQRFHQIQTIIVQ
jgi:hypothetical protein